MVHKSILRTSLLLSLSFGLVALLPGCDKDSDSSNSDGGTLTTQQEQNNNSGGSSNTEGGNAGGGSNTEGGNTGGGSNTEGANTGGGSNTEGGSEGGGSTTTEKPPQTAAALKIDWVKVKATDQFLMGSPDGVGDGDEHPQHKVKLSGFWMSATEVTNAQYNQFLESLPDGDPHKQSGSNYSGLDNEFKGADQPAVCVSYDDALAFCKWVGHGVTLPTEAQWEYACRAGTTTNYSFGDALTAEQANIEGSTWQENGKEVKEQTRAVRQYAKNAFGLYDMHGNVFEWCLDWYADDYYQECKGAGTEDKTVSDPKGFASGSGRVIRGGGWDGGAGLSRSADRANSYPEDTYVDVGFRVVAPVAP